MIIQTRGTVAHVHVESVPVRCPSWYLPTSQARRRRTSAARSPCVLPRPATVAVANPDNLSPVFSDEVIHIDLDLTNRACRTMMMIDASEIFSQLKLKVGCTAEPSSRADRWRRCSAWSESHLDFFTATRFGAARIITILRLVLEGLGTICLI